nr:YrhC family protein [uncultured Bacillus sp.]
MEKVKQDYEKMIDTKHYGIVMLAASIFFYLGIVIPSVAQSQLEITVMIVGTITLLVGSWIFFSLSKVYRRQLLETEEGQEYLEQKKNV